MSDECAYVYEKAQRMRCGGTREQHRAPGLSHGFVDPNIRVDVLPEVDTIAEEWRVEPLAIHGWRVVETTTGREVVSSVYRQEDAERIVTEHAAVQLALHSGRNWTLIDWRNWLRWRAITPPKGAHDK